MAGRKPLAIGSLGKVEYVDVDGGVHARARTRDAGGNVRRLFKSATDRALALELLQAQAKSLAFATEDLDQKTTLSSLLDAWIEDRSGQIKGQSIRQYRDTVRWLTPIAGALTVEELRPARIKNLLASIESTRSASAKHHARVALNGALGIAVELDVIPANPLRSMRRRPMPKATPIALNVHQFQVLRRLIVEREERVRPRTQGAVGASMLRWATDVQLGSGLRISEVLALRHMDVDLQAGTIDVTGTMVDDDEWHLIRQDGLMSREQARIIELPSYSIRVLEEARATCRDLQSRLPTAPALPGTRGNHLYPRNVRRALRLLRVHPVMEEALSETGVVPDQLKPHTLRRTAATLVGPVTGSLEASQLMLGHADMKTTRDFYAGAAYRRVGSAAILDTLLSGDAVVG